MMVTITYGLTGAPATDGRARTGQRPHLFARFMKALHESRLRQARCVIEKHAHLLPSGHFLKLERERRNVRL
jgi:hypothetical protein